MNVIYYVETNLICIVLLLLFGYLIINNFKQQSRANDLLSCIIIITIAFCVTDMIAGVFRGQIFTGARTIISVSNWLYYELLSVISYLWFFYVLLRFNYNNLSRKKVFVYSLPLMIFTIVALTNFYSGFMFSINDQNLYVRGQGVIVHWFLTWGYFVASTIITIKTYVKEKSKMKRKEIQPLMYFIIAPTIAAPIQMMFYGVTSTQVGITISIIMICIANQNAQILTDPLTGLNNRRGLDRYFDSYLNYESKQELMLMMIDINRFKNFNDTYGHIVGDKAIIEISHVLKMACKEAKSHLFLCRYGGDEFLIAGYFENKEKVNELKQFIYDSCSQIDNLPCPINVSIGYASAICHDNQELEQLMNQSDSSMYEEKSHNRNEMLS